MKNIFKNEILPLLSMVLFSLAVASIFMLIPNFANACKPTVEVCATAIQGGVCT